MRGGAARGPDIVAQASCVPAETITEARYRSFGDTAARDAYFASLLAPVGPLPDEGSCRDGPFSGSFSILSPDGQGGSYLLACYATTLPSSGQVHILWTDPDVPIIGMGILDGDDFMALHEWWLDFGPSA